MGERFSNGFDSGHHEVLNAVREIKDSQEGMIQHLQQISEHTRTAAQDIATVALVFKNFTNQDREQLKEMTTLASGKKHIPVSIFIILMVLFGAYVIVDKVEKGDVVVKMTTSGIEISHGAK